MNYQAGIKKSPLSDVTVLLLCTSHRYVVCLNKISYTDPVHDHLFNINLKLNKLKRENVGEPQDEQLDVLEVCIVLEYFRINNAPLFTVGDPFKYNKQ